MYFDRYDVCEAWWLFAGEWHRGAGSAEYGIFTRLSRMGFKSSPLLSKDTLTENGRDILASLIRRARSGEIIGRVIYPGESKQNENTSIEGERR